MKRSSGVRLLRRAAKHLEHEAKEYIEWAKTEKTEVRYCGRRAATLFGLAYSLRQLADSGTIPTCAKESNAVGRALKKTGAISWQSLEKWA